MKPQSSSFRRARAAVMCSLAACSVFSPAVRADEDPHVQADTFAAEAAALLPAADVISKAVPTPTQRILYGNWSSVIPWTPHIPVSAATLPDGRVLTFASNERTSFPAGPEFTYAATWNPATGQFVEYNHPSHDMFCGALVMLPDGRVLVNGGRNTTIRSSIFDYRSNAWTRTPDMNDARWYNTTVALPNGRAWTVSGSGGSGTAERFDVATGWSRQTGINWNLVTSEPGYINIWHPFLVVAPDGRLIHFGPTDTMHWVNTDNTGSMTNTGTVVPGAHYPKEGSWVMFDEGRILVAGGGSNTTANPNDTTTGISSKTAYTVDVRTGTPVVTPAASLNFARQFANATVLPNGEVIVMGGNTSGLKFNDTGSILTPEIWNPTNGQWRQAADMSVPRNYHSLALLLPDGRVLSGGGGLGGGNHQDAQLYTPPTLFNADGTLATRPVLSAAPAKVGAATRFNVSGTAGLQKFSFIKMSAITHSVNTDLRYLSLPFTETSQGNYELTAHASLNVMTPGYWMLFGLNAAGVHSVAKIVQVDAVAAVNVTPPGNQSSYVSQPASLQMIGTGPAGSVLNWSALGLPAGLAIHGTNGLISGTPTNTGTFTAQVTLRAGAASNTTAFTWTIQPATFSRNFTTFTNATGLTLNGNAALSGNVLRLAPKTKNKVGSAFLTAPILISSNTSLSTRFVFRTHGTTDGADGLAFIIQGNAATAIGGGNSGLGYSGMTKSLAVEMDNNQNTGDPNGNHLGLLTNGNVTAHLATFTPGWDLEDGQSHTIWVEYDGVSNQLRVYAAQGIVTTRPGSPVLTATIDLPTVVGGSQAWVGFSGATGSVNNNHDIESWSLTVNAFSLPAQPVLTAPGVSTSVIGSVISRQLSATDPNGDLLTWSATGLPTGLSINPASGLISGTPSLVGVFSPTVAVTDSNTPPVSANFTWTINDLLAVQPLSGTVVLAGSTVTNTAVSSGGLNPQYRWNFGDGSPDTAFSSSPTTTHAFPIPGRYAITVTVRDDTGREVTASYHQAVHAPLTAARPTASSSIAYESKGTNSRVWVVNPDNDSVSVFHTLSYAKLAEVNVGRAPRSLALAPDGRVWVANTESATLTILRTNFTVAQTISLPRGSRPFGVVFDPAGLNAYVALEASGKILKLNPTNGATIASLEVGPAVRHLSVTADGTKIFATRFITPRLPGEDTASPQTTVNGVKYGGQVLTIDRATFALAGTIILEHSERPDSSIFGRGIPNYLGAAIISPNGQTAWVASKQDNIRRGQLRINSQLSHDQTVRSIASRINLTTLTEETTVRLDFDNAGIASAAAFDPQGVFLFTALEGSREVAVADTVANQEILRFESGRAPQGLVLSPDGRKLFVHNFMDRTISVHDLTALVNGTATAPPAPIVLPCVTTEQLAANVLIGKQFFYDSRDTRIALQQYISCAACHNDGGQDGRIWDFTQFGEGLRNTITLRGHGGTAQGPVHWTGNFDEIHDFEGQMRNFAGGTGLMSDSNYFAGTRSHPLGDTKAGFSADLDALAAYVSSLTKNGDSPDRNVDGTFTSAALAGQAVFQQQNCAQCHAGPQFTDSALNVFRNVGTLKPSSGQRLGSPLTGLDTPTLLGLWDTGPYLHDGSAATLEQAVSAHTNVTINPADLTNLVAYLRQLDDGGASSPTLSGIPDQITLVNTATAPIPFVLNDLDTPLVNVTVSGTSSNLVLVPNANIVFGGSGTDRTVTISPAPHRIGTAVITITVSDGLFSVATSFVLTVQRKTVAVAGVAAASKAYDGTTATSLDASSASLVGVEAGDEVTLDATGASAAFVNRNVGDEKSVQITGLSLGGIHADSYTLTQPGTKANITAKGLVATGIIAQAKIYDGTVSASLDTASAALIGVVSGDEVGLVTAGASAAFADKNAGLGKPVSITGVALGGSNAANYSLTQPNALATIAPVSLTVTAENKSRHYGADNPSWTAAFVGFVPGESLLNSGVTGSPALNCTATNTTPPGAHPITTTMGTLQAINYSFACVGGTLTISSPGQVRVAAIVRLPNQHARLTGTGDPGVAYQIQSSTNLTQWADLGTVTAGEDGAYEFDDANAAALGTCFYRVRLP